MAAEEASSSSKGSISKTKSNSITTIDVVIFFILIVVTVVTHPKLLHWTSPTKVGHVSLNYVWYYGWITAISTGLGALPFIFFKEPDKLWMGISNAVAGGMMIAASYSLVLEGIHFDHECTGNYRSTGTNLSMFESSASCTVLGVVAGVLFLVVTKRILDRFEAAGVEVSDIDSTLNSSLTGADINKMFLIVFVMTLHSLTEGIGIGVSFGGNTGMQFGPFVSLSLALHNVPEGLAVALVLTQRRVHVLRAGLWAVFTSLPQPLTAIPAFLFVERFALLLPLGLGFAAGAMSYVALFELLVEAVEDAGLTVTGTAGLMSCVTMIAMQHGLKYVL